MGRTYGFDKRSARRVSHATRWTEHQRRRGGTQRTKRRVVNHPRRTTATAAQGNQWAQIQTDWFQQTWTHHGFLRRHDWSWYRAHPVSEMQLLNTGVVSDNYAGKFAAEYSFAVAGVGDGGSTPSCLDANDTWTIGMRYWEPLGSPWQWFSDTRGGVYWHLDIPNVANIGRLRMNVDGVDRYRWEFDYSTHTDFADSITLNYVADGFPQCTGLPSSITLNPKRVPAIIFPDRYCSDEPTVPYDSNNAHTSFSAAVDTSEELQLFFPRWTTFSRAFSDREDMWAYANWIPPRAFVRYDSDNIITGVMLNQVGIPFTTGTLGGFLVWAPHNVHLTMTGATDPDYNDKFLLMAKQTISGNVQWLEPEAPAGDSYDTTKFRMYIDIVQERYVEVISAGVVVATYQSNETAETDGGDYTQAITLHKLSGTADWPGTLEVVGKYDVGGYYAKP